MISTYRMAHRTFECFDQMLKWQLKSKDPIAFEIPYGEVNEDLYEKFEDKFPDKWEDSITSFSKLEFKSGSKNKHTYKYRIMKHFGKNQISGVIADSRNIISTWDQRLDQTSVYKPCLLSIKFNIVNDKLNMIVVFRNRDLIKRLIVNWYCLHVLWNKVAIDMGKEPGVLYDFSMQSYIDKNSLQIWNKH